MLYIGRMINLNDKKYSENPKREFTKVIPKYQTVALATMQ